MPNAVTIETRSRCTGCPQFIIIFHHRQYFGRTGWFVIERQSHLEEDSHILLPKMIVKEVVFLITTIYLIIIAGYTHHLFFGSGAVGSRQVVIKQVINCDETPCDVSSGKVGRKKLFVSRWSSDQGFEKLTQLFRINFFLSQVISLIEIGGVLPEFFGTAVYISHCRIVGVQSLRSTALQFFVFLM